MNRVLVFGGAKEGIGRAVVQRMIHDGHIVTATYEATQLDEYKEFLDSTPAVTWVSLDSGDLSAHTELLMPGGQFEGVVNAEFDFYMESAAEFDLARWSRSLSANLTLPKWIGHHATNTWATKSVAFITSSEANTGSFGAHAYAATKAAVHNLTKSLANTAAGSCRFNSVAAGWIGGVMDTDEVFNMSRRITPLGRLGVPEEIAATAAWLLGDQSSFINGSTLMADGGYTGVDSISKFEYQTEYGVMDPKET